MDQARDSVRAPSGKPQENGRQERFHRTLKVETARPPHADQRAFDTFRREYNEERPHEALGQTVPRAHFEASPRRYPRGLLRFACNPWDQPLRVDAKGCVKWAKQRIFLNVAIAHEHVALGYREDGWDVVFGPISLGVLKPRGNEMKFHPSKGRMMDTREVSGMSSD